MENVPESNSTVFKFLHWALHVIKSWQVGKQFQWVLSWPGWFYLQPSKWSLRIFSPQKAPRKPLVGWLIFLTAIFWFLFYPTELDSELGPMTEWGPAAPLTLDGVLEVCPSLGPVLPWPLSSDQAASAGPACPHRHQSVLACRDWRVRVTAQFSSAFSNKLNWTGQLRTETMNVCKQSPRQQTWLCRRSHYWTLVTVDQSSQSSQSSYVNEDW